MMGTPAVMLAMALLLAERVAVVDLSVRRLRRH
jgi:hypothetical protein